MNLKVFSLAWCKQTQPYGRSKIDLPARGSRDSQNITQASPRRLLNLQRRLVRSISLIEYNVFAPMSSLGRVATEALDTSCPP